MYKKSENAPIYLICLFFLYNTHKIVKDLLIYSTSETNYYAKLPKTFLGNVSYSKENSVLILFS